MDTESCLHFLSRDGFRVFGIESVSHLEADGSLVSIFSGTPHLLLEEFYFADGFIIRAKQPRSRRPASASGWNVATAHPAAITDGDHHHLLALQHRRHLFAYRGQNGMNSFGCG